ncbi:MAG: hypothetical protein JWN78_507, partial [Bacteroidota bacterium]|nr:hypothetical protein [Bacteroidota bacterium]
MRFQPTKQINAIIQQEYFESTISWAFRVVLALNVPLLLLPLKFGFKPEIVWMAFTAYLLSLLDFRGPHYQKVFIQIVESVLIIFAAVLGMYVSGNIWLSVFFMFAIGMFAALVRNWSDYGAALGVATGFFYLFGLSNPVSFAVSIHFGEWMIAGALWALFITVFSFPFQPSRPLKRSVANIWKNNTELLDSIITENLSSSPDISAIVEKEIAVRAAINKSIELFKRRQKSSAKTRTHHYDIIIELRKVSSLFGAAITSLHEELEMFNGKAFEEIRSSIIYKTLSAFGQASARIAIVTITDRVEDLAIAKIRVKRCGIAIKILKERCEALPLTDNEVRIVNHFVYTLQLAMDYLTKAVQLLEEKISLNKSVHLEEYKLTFNNFLAGLNPYEWVLTARTLFNINSQQFLYALRVAIALSVGTFIFIYFHINHGYWIPLTILIVIQPYYGATLKKGLERVIGTVAGIVAGGVISLFTLPHIVLVFLLIIVSFLLVYNIRNNYKVGVFYLTLMMVVMLHLTAQASWSLIAWRVLSTCIGAVLAVGAGYAFWPVWEKQLFPPLMSAALQQNKKYLEHILSCINGEISESEAWIKQRNAAEAANSDVFACVQRMHDEPQHIQHRTDANFDIVGINIRITREITSIALALPGLTLRVFPGIEIYREKVTEVFDILNEFILKKNISNQKSPDFKMFSGLLQTNDSEEQHRFIKTELEKIVFELETMYELIRIPIAVN